MSHSNCLVHGTRYLQASSSPAGILASLGGGGGGNKWINKGANLKLPYLCLNLLPTINDHTCV